MEKDPGGKGELDLPGNISVVSVAASWRAQTGDRGQGRAICQ